MNRYLRVTLLSLAGIVAFIFNFAFLFPLFLTRPRCGGLGGLGEPAFVACLAAIWGTLFLVYRCLRQPRGKAAARATRLFSILFVPAVLVVLIFYLALPNYLGAIDRGRQKYTVNTMERVATALHNYHTSYGKFPTADSTDEFASIVADPSLAHLTDGWRNPLHLHSGPTGFTIIAFCECNEPDVPRIADYEPGTTWDTEADIVLTDAGFVRRPEGIVAKSPNP